MSGVQGSAARRGTAAGVLRSLAQRLADGALGDAPAELKIRLAGVVEAAVGLLAELERGSRSCDACGSDLVRKSYESPTAFARRRTCGQACAAVLRAALHRAKEDAAGITKVCPACRREFHRRMVGDSYEAPSTWAARRFCSRSCGTSWRHTNSVPRAKSLAPRKRPVAAPRTRPSAAAQVARQEPQPLPDPRPHARVLIGPPTPIVGSIAVDGRSFDESVCAEHAQQRGFFGCPACNASASRRAAARSRPITPHPDGGR